LVTGGKGIATIISSATGGEGVYIGGLKSPTSAGIGEPGGIMKVAGPIVVRVVVTHVVCSVTVVVGGDFAVFKAGGCSPSSYRKRQLLEFILWSLSPHLEHFGGALGCSLCSVISN
jgi:hypothetical protein